MPTAPFAVSPELTAIAISYKNRRLIADEVLPRVPVGKAEFKYLKFNAGDQLTIPDTKVGRKSQPNVVEIGATETAGVCVDYALMDAIPRTDIENAPANYDPLAIATEYITSLLDLHREVRTANLLTNTSNWAAGNQATLSGTSQWSDFTNSNPLDAILAAADSCVLRPNVMVIGAQAFTKLRQHPKIVGAVFGNAATSGAVMADQLAALLGFEEVLVGEAFVNTAKKGQAPTVSRAWGKDCVLIYRDRAAANIGTTTGFTAEFMGKQAYQWFDEKVGARGAEMVKVADSVAEVMCANDLGYLFKNAVA